MDLLLHLVKQQEVDIHDVRIALVLEQYLAHMDVLTALDLGDLGEFVVMASTLMEIKSRDLLPREEVDLEQELSPKDDLIRRLLEYKRYRDISRRLGAMMDRRGQMTEPCLGTPKVLRDRFAGNGAEEQTFDLGNIEIWDLTEAFAKLLEETGADKELHIDVARRNIDHYAGQILERVRGRAELDFADLFDGSLGRYELIGVFTAMLEMMKQGYLYAFQDDVTRDIKVAYRGAADVTVDEILRGDHQGFDDEPEDSTDSAARLDRRRLEAGPGADAVADAAADAVAGVDPGADAGADGTEDQATRRDPFGLPIVEIPRPDPDLGLDSELDSDPDPDPDPDSDPDPGYREMGA